MLNEKIYTVIRYPHVSEKTARVESNGQYVFHVASEATKPQIKQAISELFSVTVKSVNIVMNKGKTKQFKGKTGQRSAWKKAYVSLVAGDSIDVLGGE